jgi:hypothetical protein
MAEKRRRSPMKPTSEAAQRWAETLRAEVEQWPQVVVKRAFGMVMLYRAGVVFAALPGTRALFEQDAILIKFARESPTLLKRIAAGNSFAGAPCRIAAKRSRVKVESGESTCSGKSGTLGKRWSGWPGPMNLQSPGRQDSSVVLSTRLGDDYDSTPCMSEFTTSAAV